MLGVVLSGGNVLACVSFFFFFQAEDGIRDLVRSRGLGDVYKRQLSADARDANESTAKSEERRRHAIAASSRAKVLEAVSYTHLTLPTSDLV